MARAEPSNIEAILYAAKSTEDKRGSIPTQLEDGRRMAEHQGWAVVAEYADEAASAWSGDRGPQLAAAMEHAERIAPCVLMVQHSDRLARGDGKSARHLGEIFFWALKADISIRSCEDDSTFTNPLLAFAMGERNAEDSRRKSAAVAAGMRRRAHAGKASGGPRPCGYRYSDGRLVVVAVEAEVVRRIFSEFVAGRAMTAIARGLNADGIPTARGRVWWQAVISGMLRNPLYAGQLVHNGEALTGEHEAIIDADTWQRASELLGSNSSRRGRPSAGGHLFKRGMLRCECGGAMVGRTQYGSAYYYCLNHAQHGADRCAMTQVRRDVLDGAVYRYFEQVGLDVEATRATIAEARERKLAEIRALRVEAERQAQLAAGRLARVRGHYQDGRIDPEDWAEQREQLTGEHEAAKAEAERLRASEAETEEGGSLLDAEQEALERLTEIRRAIAGEVKDAAGTEAVRAALSRLFEGFILHRSTPERVNVELADEGWWIEPAVKPQAVEGYTESMRPILRREPLCKAENNQSVGSATR